MTKFILEPLMGDPVPPKTSEWKRPEQVMQLHRLKMKKRALQARINRTSVGNASSSSSNPFGNSSLNGTSIPQKRKNPFAKYDPNKKPREVELPELETSGDSVLFELLRLKRPESEKPSVLENSTLSFASILTKLENKEGIEPEVPKVEQYIPIDWTLNTKMRFMSPKPFPWNGKLKTSEEASGTTGFVRCLNIGEKETTLDTTPNARFHQCCLVWQHPSLPWLELFPRTAGKVSASLASNSVIANSQIIKDALYREWSESFRSLFHLLRARQCPYFYVCTNTFTVLFRAAGICGLSEIHALLTPTTRGFRQSLKQEDIEFTMPLTKDNKRRSDVTDSGCETLDSFKSTTLSVKEDEDEDEPEEKWLQSLGVEDSEIRKINSSQARMALEKETEVDNLKQSLIFVQGVEAQALFNFLINCKSATATTGALAGVPPTLLSPVAFHGATLKSLKVKESIVRVEKDTFYSIELRGPLLPHVLPSLCHMMKSSQLEQFSVSCAQLNATTSFSLANHGNGEQSESKDAEKMQQSVFGQENLSDCGFNEELLSHFCHPNPKRIQNLEKVANSRKVCGVMEVRLKSSETPEHLPPVTETTILPTKDEILSGVDLPEVVADEIKIFQTTFLNRRDFVKMVKDCLDHKLYK